MFEQVFYCYAFILRVKGELAVGAYVDGEVDAKAHIEDIDRFVEQSREEKSVDDVGEGRRAAAKQRTEMIRAVGAR